MAGAPCAGSGDPLHPPLQISGPVVSHVVQVCDAYGNLLMAYMSPRRDRIRLILALADTQTGKAAFAAVSPEQVRTLVSELGTWIGWACTDSALAASVATPPGRLPGEARPAFTPIRTTPSTRVTARTAPDGRAELALAVVSLHSRGFAALALHDVADTLDELTRWLEWVDLLTGTGLHADTEMITKETR